ncbi:MAG: hypothetical protein EA412_11155 [Chitinophagaceae bacterium]|nr:MAG: hypothetical protein EA412_11155 [Chitinophagaceae bacterium]
MKKHAIAVLSDEGHLEKAKQIIYSSYKFGNWKGEYILLAYEIQDKSKLKWFTDRNIRIVHTHYIPEHGMSPENPVSIFYAKLFLFDPALKGYHSILYLDTDMIVRKDLSELLKYDSFAAADDCYLNPFYHQFGISDLRIYKNYPNRSDKLLNILESYNVNKTSFNAGMMLIDSYRNTQERYDEILAEVKKFGAFSVLGDQGVLNAYFQKIRKRIPYVYNDFYQSDDFNRNSFLKRKNDSAAVILHLTYPYKPWNPKSDYYKEWKQNLENSDKLFDEVEQIGQKPTAFKTFTTDFINWFNVRRIRFQAKLRFFFSKF